MVFPSLSVLPSFTTLCIYVIHDWAIFTLSRNSWTCLDSHLRQQIVKLSMLVFHTGIQLELLLWYQFCTIYWCIYNNYEVLLFTQCLTVSGRFQMCRLFRSNKICVHDLLILFEWPRLTVSIDMFGKFPEYASESLKFLMPKQSHGKHPTLFDAEIVWQ